jgi:hypothetical protein
MNGGIQEESSSQFLNWLPIFVSEMGSTYGHKVLSRFRRCYKLTPEMMKVILHGVPAEINLGFHQIAEVVALSQGGLSPCVGQQADRCG